MQQQSVFLENEAATEKFGASLAAAIVAAPGAMRPPRDAADGSPAGGGRITLSGDLGAGKTTLVRGLMRAYGYKGAVKSPTYTLVEPYEMDGVNIYHFDLYRLGDPEELEFLGVWDYFEAGNLCIVEWPEMGKGALPAMDLALSLQMAASGRRVNWHAQTDQGRQIAERLVKYA